MVQQLIDLVTGVGDAVQAGLDALGAKIIGSIDGLIGDNESFIGRAFELMQASIDANQLVADRSIAAIEVKIGDRIDDTLEESQGIFAAIGEKLTIIPAAIGDGVDDILDAIQDKVVAPIDAVLETVQAQADEVITALGGMLSVVLEQITSGLGDALQPLKDMAEGIGTGVTGALGSFIPNLVEFIAPDAWERVRGIVEDFESTPDLPQEIKSLTNPGAIPLVGAAAVLLPVIAFAAVNAMVGVTMGPWLLNVAANVNRKARPMRLAVGDTVRAKRRGFIGQERANDEAAQVGFSDERFALMQELDTQQLIVQESISLWLREVITEEELDTRLTELGFRSPDFAKIKELAFPIPAIPDLIQMAVREVFTPEIAEKFGQFDEIPPDYTLWAKRQGLSEFWSRNVWAAHWVLPSIQMGFEMLHRSVIDTETLEQLFVAQDVMPFWRDKLIDISFNPFTRVDVRRMHAAGVLTDDEVFRAYLDLGYDDTKAGQLTEFTLAITAAQRAPRADRERDLTKADIIGLFGTRLIGKEEAATALMAIGFDESESGLLIARQEIKMLTTSRAARKELIFDKFRVGTINFAEAQDALVEMDLTSVELDQAITDLIALRERRLRLPTKANFDKFFSDKLIDAAEYREGLRLLGFAEHWIELFARIVDAGTIEDDIPEAEL